MCQRSITCAIVLPYFSQNFILKQTISFLSKRIDRHDFLALCLEGEPSIPARKDILAHKKEALLQSIQKLQEAIDYIDWKQNFYDDVLSGKAKYYSNLIGHSNSK